MLQEVILKFRDKIEAMEKDVYAVLQLEAEEKEMQQSEAQVRLRAELSPMPGSPAAAVTVAPPLSAAHSTGGTFLLSRQINTAKKLLEKDKEAPGQEPERSWFQTREERKKEKGGSGIPRGPAPPHMPRAPRVGAGAELVRLVPGFGEALFLVARSIVPPQLGPTEDPCNLLECLSSSSHSVTDPVSY